MDLTPYVEGLRRDLLAAAESGDDQTRQLAERLGHALDAAARLALMEAISQATAEITSEMPAGGVDVRLLGRELDFVVDAAPPTPPAPPAPPAAPGEEDPDDGTVARVTLRIPESVKTRAEELAAKSGQSLNTWLVQAIRQATREHAVEVDLDLSSIPFLGGPFGNARGNRRMTGWL
ncbi:toxin-antitoxin system HicB family antitoxin [Nocardioides pantholopis]|uniref:toxin-antitoxin system HicB family antitoxin n=1 Tax=Nocardioides pantholopis TaxID=2483798 RepID=UPI000FD9313D|nr:toxin-antitoxin system HicB family antitoxin [Nocardioides pantholopis]